MNVGWLEPFAVGLFAGSLVVWVTVSLLFAASDADDRQEQWAAGRARDMSRGLTPLTEQRGQLRLVGSGPYDWAREECE